MGLKRAVTLLLFLSRKPFFWLWRAVVHPGLTLGYQVYRLFRKAISSVIEPLKDSASNLLSSRYAVHVIVVVVSFLVTATNIAASGTGEMPLADAPDRSILARLTLSDTERLAVEEATEGVALAQEVSYLGDQAISAQEFYTNESSYIGTDDGVYDDTVDNEGLESHISNAVRVTPEAISESGASTRTKVIQHVVLEGESIGAISRTYGLSTQTVLAANGLSARSVIRPGQSLKILPVDGISYTVKRGDTLGKIASTYGTDVSQIMEYNGLLEATELQIGDEIILPGGKLPPPRPAPAPTRIASDIRDVFIPPPAADPDSGTAMLWPTACRRITQYYRYRHTGLDIACPLGTAIYAADDGVVIFSGWNSGGYGNMIIIDHGNGLYTRYAHGSKLLYKKGDVAKRGEVIMLMGSTGRSTGSHLHFEVMRGGIYSRVNPLDYTQ